ncbi:uroporphyrinogen-III synthase [Gemmobacter aquatilis]|uniref:Uroporphyrinogen-III synthase n=2 Tax=Gemmobacter aquatilis TaxID=933059 RepID=A0A1H7Z156_9RHOB|nr:uroporphyrinogen-III synthase [Gemmobacter aquatilis]
MVILTRPADQGARFAKALRLRLGPVVVLQSPLIQPKFRVPDVPDRAWSAVIFTSGTAVAACEALPAPLRQRLPRLAFCVGHRTAELAKMAGFETISANGDAEALIRCILAKAPQPPLLHLHGAETRGDIAACLTEAGIEASGVVLYDQLVCPLSGDVQTALRGDTPLILPVFSPRTADLLAADLADARAPLHLVAISQATAAPVSRLPLASLTIAARPDADAMLDAVEHLFAAATRLEP